MNEYIPNKKVYDHYNWIDLIRFLAAFLVVLYHYRCDFFVDFNSLPLEQKSIPIFIFFSITRLGHEAVLMFFVMSGFLVGGKAIKKIVEGQFHLKKYIIDRSVRIMLPLISALFLIALINLIIGHKTNIIDWFGNLFSLQGILVNPLCDTLWSLSYEVWFYVIMGLISLLISKNFKLSFIAFTILIICFLVFTKLHPVYLFIWFIGAIAFFNISQRTSIWKIIINLMLIIFWLIILQITTDSKSIVNNRFISHLPTRDVSEILFSLFFALFLMNVITLIPKSRFMVSFNELGSRLAAFSYTLYLTHRPIQQLLQFIGFPKSDRINIASLSFFFLELIIALSVAWVIYFFFEKRTKFIKQKVMDISNGSLKLEIKYFFSHSTNINNNLIK